VCLLIQSDCTEFQPSITILIWIASLFNYLVNTGTVTTSEHFQVKKSDVLNGYLYRTFSDFGSLNFILSGGLGVKCKSERVYDDDGDDDNDDNKLW
jgi:hypothetical protein